MAKKNIHPELFMRKVIQPDNTVIEVVTTQANAKDYILPTNLKEHPAWSKTQFGALNRSEKNNSRTRNTGADIFQM